MKNLYILTIFVLIFSLMRCAHYKEDKIWDSKYLLEHQDIAMILSKFESGKICSSLKNLDNKSLTHSKIIDKLKNEGYSCFLRAMTFTPDLDDKRFIKKDGTISLNSADEDIVWQQICVLPKEGCVVRIKMDGFPGNRRSYPQSTKAILIEPAGQITYANEAFQITYDGRPVPKFPSEAFGLALCPYKQNEKLCTQRIDHLMRDSHPKLKAPIRGKLSRKT